MASVLMSFKYSHNLCNVIDAKEASLNPYPLTPRCNCEQHELGLCHHGLQPWVPCLLVIYCDLAS